MVDKLYAKAGVWTDILLGKQFRTVHPLRANLFDAAILASWTCWILGLALGISKLL